MSVTNTCNIKDNPCLYDKADHKKTPKDQRKVYLWKSGKI